MCDPVSGLEIKQPKHSSYSSLTQQPRRARQCRWESRTRTNTLSNVVFCTAPQRALRNAHARRHVARTDRATAREPRFWSARDQIRGAQHPRSSLPASCVVPGATEEKTTLGSAPLPLRTATSSTATRTPPSPTKPAPATTSLRRPGGPSDAERCFGRARASSASKCAARRSTTSVAHCPAPPPRHLREGAPGTSNEPAKPREMPAQPAQSVRSTRLVHSIDVRDEFHRDARAGRPRREKLSPGCQLGRRARPPGPGTSAIDGPATATSAAQSPHGPP